MKKNSYWEVINPKKAIEIFAEGKTEIYKLYKDNTESLIENENDLHEAIDLSIELAIEKYFY